MNLSPSLLLSQILSDPSTFYFSVVILIITAYGILGSFSRNRIYRNTAQLTSGFVVTLGILGTFWGIALGLINFDVENIDGSVPQLLAGMKIAFLTSIVGMAASIIIKLFQAVFGVGQKSATTTPGDIHSALLSIKDVNLAGAEHLKQGFEKLQTAIAGDADGSMGSQLQKLRLENRDGQQSLISEFRDFSKHMTENNQKALIEALKDVIHDFNEKLTEQFGENFKELNVAVHKLVEWQDNYRSHLESMEQHIVTAVSAVDRSQAALQSIEEHASAIPAAIAPLTDVMQGLNHQTADLAAHLDAVAALKDQAIETFPVIEKNLVTMTSQLAQHVDQAIEKTNETLSRHTANFRTLEEGFDALQRSASNAQQTFNAELDKTLEAINAQLTLTITKHADLIDQNAKSAQQAVEKVWDKTGSGLDEQFKTFDREMQQELSRTIEAMGQNLASLSEKFVSDYQPLTERLREIVQMAGQVSR